MLATARGRKVQNEAAPCVRQRKCDRMAAECPCRHRRGPRKPVQAAHDLLREDRANWRVKCQRPHSLSPPQMRRIVGPCLLMLIGLNPMGICGVSESETAFAVIAQLPEPVSHGAPPPARPGNRPILDALYEI